MDLSIPADLESSVRIGTCSWKYDSWKGLIYPVGKRYRPDDYLPIYASQLKSVEVDQWFWSLFPSGVKLPETKTVTTYAASVPDDFIFTVKVPNSITLTHFYAKQPKQHAAHANRPNEYFLSVPLFERFLERISPIHDKLGPLMFQFEYLNRKKMTSKDQFFDQLSAFFESIPKEFQYAIETRNPNYLSDDFFQFLKEKKLGYVFIEGYYMPHIGDVFDKYATMTADHAVIRLHGGDRKEMEEKTANLWDRIVFKQDEGLNSAARITRAIADWGATTYVNINNHYEGCAPRTIERFVNMLRG